jgi:PAS domain S-box-containing protein
MSFDRASKIDLIREIERLQQMVTVLRKEEHQGQVGNSNPDQIVKAKATNSRIHKSMEGSSLLAITTNPEGIIQGCNDAFCQSTHYTKNELIGHSIFDFLVPSDLKDLYLGGFERFIEKGELPENLKDRIRHKSGRPRSARERVDGARSTTGGGTL